MSRNRILYFITQALFILKVSSQGQPVKQYILTRGPQSQAVLSKIPALNPVKQPNIPTGQYFIPGPTFAVPPTSEIVSQRISPPQLVPTGISSISPSQIISAGSPNPALGPISQIPCQNQMVPQSALSGPIMLPQSSPVSPIDPHTSISPVLDTHVLNNLAIALQLLIVNNILNKPLPEPTVGAKSPFDALKSLVPYSSPIPEIPSQSTSYLAPNEYGSVSYNQFTPMPNANFLGGSSLVGNASPMFGMGGAKSPTRSSLTLMSPYEALGPNSPFADPILSSQYAPATSKADFQSPYAAILSDGNNDLFSMIDLY